MHEPMMGNTYNITVQSGATLHLTQAGVTKAYIDDAIATLNQRITKVADDLNTEVTQSVDAMKAAATQMTTAATAVTGAVGFIAGLKDQLDALRAQLPDPAAANAMAESLDGAQAELKTAGDALVAAGTALAGQQT
jgi:hypothetical protein